MGPILIGVGALGFTTLAVASLVSLSEGEVRASGRLVRLAMLGPIPYLAAAAVPGTAGVAISIVLLTATTVGLAALLVPTGSRHRAVRHRKRWTVG